jgi:6-pyruvoyltetrahydropterin/6-carboxytetrahydropterin synthase
MRISVTKEFHWEAAHRLTDYIGACANIHGHSYRAEVTVSCLDATPGMLINGMIMDFTEMKFIIDGWIHSNWDHALIINQVDIELIDLISKIKQRTYIMSCNTTAENMAMKLMHEINAIFDLSDQGYRIIKVRLWETENNSVEVISE